MKKSLMVCFSLWFVIGVAVAVAADSTAFLSLEAALARVEHHADYQAWLDSFKEVEDTIQSIEDKYSLGIDLSGDLLSYDYNFDRETSQLSTGGSLSLSKSNLSGTTFTGSITPSLRLDDVGLTTTWSIGVQQAILPTPRLSSDQLSLTIAKETHAVLTEQRNYILINTSLKIEDLYRSAQLAQARVSFAETSLENARSTLEIITQKVEMGEASEADLISGELGVLRGERELESSIINAQTAMDNLLATLDLDLNDKYQLPPLEVDKPPLYQAEIDLDQLLSDLEDHPLVLHFRYELKKVHLELEAAKESSKPQADLSIRLNDTPISQSQSSGGLRFEAAVRVGYPLLDRNQRIRTFDASKKSLESVEESYQDALDHVRKLIEDGAFELAKLARDQEIARLSFRQAELEWEAAQAQYDLGIIDYSTRVAAEMALVQAELDYWEACHRHDLARRALSLGIVGDLPGGLPR